MKILSFNIINEYPDLISVICIPLIISVLAIALPLLSENRHKIESRYNSDKIVECFERSHVCRFFNIFLFISLVAILLWVFHQPRLEFNVDFINLLVENSAWLLLLISTVMLVIYMFSYISHLRKFNNPFNLFKILQRLYKKTRNEEKRKFYFLTMSDLFFFSIQKSNEELSRSLLDFFMDCFAQEIKDKDKQEEIVYPSEYYELIYKSNGLINIMEKKISSVLNGGVMFDYLINFIQPILSPNSYNIIWSSVRQAIFYNDDNMIFSYWKKAHQHRSLSLKEVYAQYDSAFSITNQEEITNREKVIKEYKEFHYVLGALILCSERYNLLKKCFSFTQSMPVRYYLIPNNYISLLLDYIDLKDDYRDPFHFMRKYSFPNTDSVDSNGVILMWITRYFAILFLRQYGIADIYSSNYYKVNLPQLPDTLAKLSEWENKIEALKYYVEYYINERTDILKQLDIFNSLKPESLISNKQEAPISKLNSYIKEIKEKYAQIKIEQDVSKEKKEFFEEKSKNIIKACYNKLSLATNNRPISETNILGNNFIGRPRHDILEKGAFSNDQDISYSGSDSITAEAVTLEMLHYFTISFTTVVDKKYNLFSEDIFKAIDKLTEFIENKKDFIIVSIGISISHQMNYNKPLKLEEKDGQYFYDSIKIVEIGYSQVNFINNSFFILKRTDLPSLTKHELSQNTIKKYEYELVDPEYKIYTNIINLHEKTELKDEILITYTGERNLDESVLACVGVNYELKWSKNAKATQIQIYNSFQQVGNANSISDIIPLSQKIRV